MPIPESINDLSEIPEENSPQGGENIGGTLDDFLRAFQAIMKRDLALKKAETATGTSFKPAGGLVAKNVQEALRELSTKHNSHKHSSADLTDFELSEKTSEVDLRSLDKDGIYAFGGGGVNTPKIGPYKVLNLMGKNNYWKHQLAFKAYSTEIYVSSQQSSGSSNWFPWQRLVTSDINGYITPDSTVTRDQGVYGVYDPNKIAHVWGMGTSYKIPSDGSNFGNFYGIAYKHTTNPTGGTMANGHQIVFVNNGIPGVSIGLDGNVWAKGQFMGSGAGLTNVPWSSLVNVPSTFTPSSHNHTASQITGLPAVSQATSVSTLVQRDGNGDIHARLLRSNYADQSTISGAIAFRINNSTDNYTRYCNSPGAVRAWLGLHASATRVANWSEITGKPTTFPPSTHTHPWSQVTGVPVQATRWPNAGEQGYTQSLSAAGWCKLPNGLILQWVKGSKTTKVNWPIAFKTIFLAVDSHLSNGSGNFDTDLFYDNVRVWGRYQNEFRAIGIGI